MRAKGKARVRDKGPGKAVAKGKDKALVKAAGKVPGRDKVATRVQVRVAPDQVAGMQKMCTRPIWSI